MKSQQLDIKNMKGYKLNAYLELPPNQRVAYYAISAHCFTCNSNINAVRHISKALTAKKIGVVRFDFTGLGKSEGTFAESHFSANISDLIAVYRYMETHDIAPTLLIGHSLGGAAVIAAADHLPRLKAIATIGAPSRVDHVKRLLNINVNSQANEADWEVNIGGRPFVINNTFVEEMQKTDLRVILGRVNKPILFMHSPNDQIVSIENAHSLYTSARHPKSFISLDNADHLLSDKNDSKYVTEIIVAWVSRYLPSK